jgi:hypothetical protein
VIHYYNYRIKEYEMVSDLQISKYCERYDDSFVQPDTYECWSKTSRQEFIRLYLDRILDE